MIFLKRELNQYQKLNEKFLKKDIKVFFIELNVIFLIIHMLYHELFDELFDQS